MNAVTDLPGWLTGGDRLSHSMQLRAVLPPQMQAANRWLVHREKQPFYPDGTPRRGELDTPEDVARMGTFDDALRTYQAGGFDGIGFALGDGWQGIDLDYIESNGLAHLVDQLPGYVEHSPSGKGVHAIGFGESFNNLDANASGVEAYCSKRFFTVTGDRGRGTIACIAGFVRAAIEPVHSSKARKSAASNNDDAQGTPIAEGSRNVALASLAGTMRSRGMTASAIEAGLLAHNSERCVPPLPDKEVRQIARSMARYPVTNDAAHDDASHLFGAVPCEGIEWPELQPLIAKIEAQEYPLDALPDAVRCAVQEVAGFVKAPVPLIATSALAALSLAIQAHVDVQRADKLHGPCGLFLLAIAESGERKTTCDGFFTKAIHDHEAAMLEVAKPAILAQKSEHAAWSAKRAGLLEKIKTLSKGGNSTAAKAQELHDLDDNEPTAPRVPRLVYGDTTPEELGFKLAMVWPSGGVISSEAGTVFGGHAMGKDSAMRNMAMLNQLWDGATLKVDRRTSASFTVQGARLTIALQVQEATLRAFFESLKGLARGMGFLARFLVSWPESTQGTRYFTEAPTNWPHLAAFNNRLSAILNRLVAIDSDGGLTPAMLTLAPEAKAAWVRFHDAIEAELSPGGELAEVRDVASKCADNAARLAALFHVFAGSIGPIDLAAMEAGAGIAAWHLQEARRFLGELAMPAEVSNPMRLEAWMLDYCRREKTDTVPTREVQRRGPKSLREKAAWADAVRELSELGRARLVQDGKKRQVQINPLLLA
ncbi:DUF3987 domain-containing protein [Comamonadaceae bacterium G21597-S1]|nr:DUF3987 domain-containing protein [Comamonadaceae bacterium G21597-S1]